MIDHYAMQNIKVVIADHDIAARHKVKSNLYTQGFRDFKDIGTFQDLEQAIFKEMPDLLIADFRLPGGGVCDLCYRIRHHDFEGNPFVPIVVTADNVDIEIVKKVVNSGADHFLVKPWPDLEMDERIKTLIYKRKPFVVTTDYLGPDRRTKLRDGENSAPSLVVPNVLKAKLVDGTSAEVFQAQVDQATHAVNDHKIASHVDQILWLTNKILPVYSGAGADQMLPNHLDRLIYISEDMARRCEGTRHSHQIDDLNKLYTITHNIRSRYNTPDPADVADLEAVTRHIGSRFIR